MSRRRSPLHEGPEEIEIAKNVVDRGATPTFTSLEKAACILAEVFLKERWNAERKKELISFTLRDYCRYAVKVKEAARTYLDVSLAGPIESNLRNQRGAFDRVVSADAINVERNAVPATLWARTACLAMQSLYLHLLR